MNNIELIDALISINRCTKVTKGGRNMSFSALVVVGDCNGSIGYGLGKASEVTNARLKAIEKAKKNIRRILLFDNRTIYHNTYYKHCSSNIILRTASRGRGIIAGGTVRTVCSVAGIKDIVTKSLGSNNPHNLIRAIVGGLKNIQSSSIVEARRGKKISTTISDL